MTKKWLKKKLIPFFEGMWEMEIKSKGKGYVRIDLQGVWEDTYFTDEKDLQTSIKDLMLNESEGMERAYYKMGGK